MTFKPLDFQISVPRTQEFSGMQQQAAQRPITEQNMLAHQTEKHTEAQRSQSAAVEQSSNSGIKADQEKNGGGDPRQQGRGKGHGKDESAKELPPESPHPYKGLRFDVKL
ncbi:hypothetical protein PAT3040_04279 [Paenibacillus agaridevorans]|jgi:hypothetical protein|uniref:Uncharacterized protein n=1 Tax=Paenibacillus agaridevorans TaxID=171404 RepID=A0A2R5ESF8_9BACL|nr:hypothetical protein [Paenibacillus agaridevorans]GBG09622.1 hypothetical protein PAT3040_04279 [Paenibacillus agaridevorans]